MAPARRPVRVFIGSTYRDMQAERCHPAGLTVSPRAQAQFTKEKQ